MRNQNSNIAIAALGRHDMGYGQSFIQTSPDQSLNGELIMITNGEMPQIIN